MFALSKNVRSTRKKFPFQLFGHVYKKCSPFQNCSQLKEICSEFKKLSPFSNFVHQFQNKCSQISKNVLIFKFLFMYEKMFLFFKKCS